MRKNIVRITLIAMAIAGYFLVTSSRSMVTEPCKESMEGDCCQKDTRGSDNMIWENLSGQFFSSTSLN
jgi:hypothetical protein